MRLRPITGLITVLLTSCVAYSQTRPTTQPHDFARWEKEVAAYEEADRANPPPKGAIVFTGASTMRRWKSLAADFPGQPVLNRGVGGSEIVDITHFADRIVFPYEPRMIFFRSGGNDIHKGKPVAKVFADWKQFVSTVHARLPQTRVVWVEQNPALARIDETEAYRELNRLVKEDAKDKPYIGYVETFDMVLGPDGKVRAELFVEDRLHFNDAGYKLLAERIRPHMPK